MKTIYYDMSRTLTPRQRFFFKKSEEMALNPSFLERKVKDVLEFHEVYGAEQAVVDEKYIVDFVLCEGKVIVECDGNAYHKVRNEARDQYLNNLGWRVLHLSTAVCMDRRKTWNAVDWFVESTEIQVAYA